MGAFVRLAAVHHRLLAGLIAPFASAPAPAAEFRHFGELLVFVHHRAGVLREGVRSQPESEYLSGGGSGPGDRMTAPSYPMTCSGAEFPSLSRTTFGTGFFALARARNASSHGMHNASLPSRNTVMPFPHFGHWGFGGGVWLAAGIACSGSGDGLTTSRAVCFSVNGGDSSRLSRNRNTEAAKAAMYRQIFMPESYHFRPPPSRKFAPTPKIG